MSIQTSNNGLYIFDAVYYVKSPCHEKVIKVFSQVCKKYIFQLEKGSKSGKLHYQCFLNLRVRKREKQLGKYLSGLGLEGISCRYCSDEGKAQLANYCMKDDTRIDGPWADKPLWKLQYIPNDLKCMENPLPIQKQILEMIKLAPDDRSIVWIHDKRGNTGKSKLVKWLEFTDQAEGVPFGTAAQIKSYIIACGRHTCYVVDIPRTLGRDESLLDSFSALESLKNGTVKSAMYGKVQKLFMEPPHVICFSNQLPCKYLISRDRWAVFDVDYSSLQGYSVKPLVRRLDWECAKCARKNKNRKST